MLVSLLVSCCCCCCSVAQSCLILLWPHGWTSPGSSVHGISQARILEWVAIPEGSSAGVLLGRCILHHWATWEVSISLRRLQMFVNLPCFRPLHVITKLDLGAGWSPVSMKSRRISSPQLGSQRRWRRAVVRSDLRSPMSLGSPAATWCSCSCGFSEPQFCLLSSG